MVSRKLRSLNLTLTRFFLFRHLRQEGGWCDPPRVSKLSVVEFSGKNQWIALDDYSRWHCFLILVQNLTLFWSKVIFSRNKSFFNFALVYFKNYKS